MRHNVGRTSHISQEVTHKRSLLVQQKTFCIRFWALKRPYTQIEFCFFDYNTLLRCSLITPLVRCCWCITVYLRVSALPIAVCCIPFLPVAINSSLFVLLFMSRSYVTGISCITYQPVGRTISSVWQTRIFAVLSQVSQVLFFRGTYQVQSFHHVTNHFHAVPLYLIIIIVY